MTNEPVSGPEIVWRTWGLGALKTLSEGRLLPRSVAMVLIVCLAACGDPQSAALKKLSQRGYALSVPEFFRAAEGGDVDCVRWFVDAGMEPNVADAAGATALDIAVRAGHAEVAEALLACGAAIPESKSHALLLAAVRSGSPPVLLLLLELGTRPNSKEISAPLTLAAGLGHREMAEALLPLCREHAQAALFAAAESGHVSVTSFLIKEGASIFARESEKLRTPLMLAAGRGHEPVVELLLASGADRWQLDANALSALDHAQASGCTAIVNELSVPPVAEEPAESLAQASLRVRGAADLALNLGRLIYLGCRPMRLPLRLKGLDEQYAVFHMGQDDRLEKLASGTSVPGLPWKVARRKDFLTFPGWVLQGEDPREFCWAVADQPVRHGRLSARVKDNASGLLYETCEGDTFSMTGDKTLDLRVQSISSVALVLVESSGSSQAWRLQLGGQR